MPTTIGDVIGAARDILQDTVEPYRYPDADLYQLFTQAVADARRMRPDLFLATLFGDLPSYAPADSSAAFPLWDAYQVAVVNYIVGRAELRDDQFNSDGRAGQLLSSFKAQMGTPLA